MLPLVRRGRLQVVQAPVVVLCRHLRLIPGECFRDLEVLLGRHLMSQDAEETEMSKSTEPWKISCCGKANEQIAVVDEDGKVIADHINCYRNARLPHHHPLVG